MRITQKPIVEINVDHNIDLAKEYLGKHVSCQEDLDKCINLSKDPRIKIINKNQSVHLIHNKNKVGAVIRDAAVKALSDHFGAKMKVTMNAHPEIQRGQSHESDGIMVGHGIRKNPTDSHTGTYVYKDKHLEPEVQRIYDHDGNTLAKWLYDNASIHLPWTILSYEEFKKNTQLNNESIIGALFCTKNYEAVGHVDNDRSEWAIGYVHEEGTVENGYFFYPEYGIAIEMTSNSIWCWLTKSVHGTAILNDSNGNRYTAVLTLTEKTARAIEWEKNIFNK
jgi:hypothetical protein